MWKDLYVCRYRWDSMGLSKIVCSQTNGQSKSIEWETSLRFWSTYSNVWESHRQGIKRYALSTCRQKNTWYSMRVCSNMLLYHQNHTYMVDGYIFHVHLCQKPRFVDDQKPGGSNACHGLSPTHLFKTFGLQQNPTTYTPKKKQNKT